jgi:hypothetical protein
MTLATKIVANIVAAYAKPLDLNAVSYPLDYSKRIDLTSGTGLNQADLLFTDTRTLAASGTEDLDLAGSLVDAFGATLTFARIKAIMVTALLGNTNNVNVSRTTSNGVPLFLAATDGIPVRPGGLFVWVAPDATGIAVTAGTGDLITIANSGGTTGVTYDIVIIGASA